MTKTVNKQEDSRNFGIILLTIGVFALTARFLGEVGLGLLFLPTLAAAFLTAGLIWKSIALIIPGGIIAGIGTGALLTELLPVSGDLEGAVFMFSFAAGWALVSLLGTVVEEKLLWWPFIPGSIMALIAMGNLGANWAFGLLSFSNMVWPLAFIGVGFYLLLKVKQQA